MTRLPLYALMLLVGLLPTVGVAATEPPYEVEFGYRYGFDDGEPRAQMEQQEIFLSRALPWTSKAPLNTTLGTLAAGSAGALYDPEDTAFVGQLGLGLVLSSAQGLLSADTGLAFTYISRHQFDELDLGGPIEFTSHIGFRLALFRGLGVTYRFQHMSNGILYQRNPGLNMHMLGLSQRF